MNYLSTKALTIAFGIAVSLAIASSILYTLNQITALYKDVYTTDVSIKKQFAEYSMYENTVMTGLEMYNTAKKYKDSTLVNVKCSISGASNINTSAWVTVRDNNPNDPNYTCNLYDVTYTNNNDIITINFNKR